MANQSKETILSVGATGSIGHHAVAYALKQGYQVKALVRNIATANLPAGVQYIEGDLTKLSTFEAIANNPEHQDITGIVFTHGSHSTAEQAHLVDYGAVRNAVLAFQGKPVRMALMTAIGVTVNDYSNDLYNAAHNWKRRGERLLRASDFEYTVVRPGWFDYNADDERKIVFLQGDRRRAGSPKDGVIARSAIARVLVDSLDKSVTPNKTLELIAKRGEEQADLTSLYNDLQADVPSADTDWDAVEDIHNLPLSGEPAEVLNDLKTAHSTLHNLSNY